jgi:hypothetical protein
MEQDLDKLSMHCPRCGSQATFTQHFCRSCGFSLEKVPQLVAEQGPPIPKLSTEETNKLQQRQRKIEQAQNIAAASVGVLAAISFLSGLIYLLAAGNMPLIPGVILLVVMLGGIAAGSLAIYSESLKKNLSKANSFDSKRLPGNELNQPEPDVGSFVSVTERTTNLLESQTQKRDSGA